MFQNTARIEDINGMHFYEQDFIYDDHIYSGDLEVAISATLVSPGFGLAFFNNEGEPLESQKEIYLFDLRYRKVDVIYNYNFVQKLIKSNACDIVPPVENLEYIFKKVGKEIIISTNQSIEPILQYTLPNNNFAKFSLGFYSNAGNTIHSIKINAPIPSGWILNMHNTEGGYVRFENSSFTWENCLKSAEISQTISLKKGTYYLKYTISEESDIKAYVYFSDDTRIFDERKNILNKNCFILEEDKTIIVKFSGHQGKISNISICNSESDKYLSTKFNDNTVIDGSKIIFNLSDIQYIKIAANISCIQENITTTWQMPFIGSNEKEKYINKKLLNKTYYYLFNVDMNTLSVYNNSDYTDKIDEYIFKDYTNTFQMFYNMDAIISALIIKKVNSTEEQDMINTNIEDKYISGDIISPIIVVDNQNSPYDLSSSYRIIKKHNKLLNKDYEDYIFTCREREVFDLKEELILQNKPSTESESVKVYGILKHSIINKEKLYYALPYDMTDITSYTKTYEDITDKIVINYNNGIIKIDKMLLENYDQFIVDYLKVNSYCINYDFAINSYRVTIINDGKAYSILYDAPNKNIDGLLESEHYKVLMLNSTDIMTPVNKQYVVLRKE